MLAHELVTVGKSLGIADPVAAITLAESAATVRASTIAALALGISSVPTVRIGGKLFSGSQAADEVDAFLALPPMRRTA
jgi:protein-disulfide isomerase